MKKKCNSPFDLILKMRLVTDLIFLVYYLICIYKRTIFLNNPLSLYFVHVLEIFYFPTGTSFLLLLHSSFIPHNSSSSSFAFLFFNMLHSLSEIHWKQDTFELVALSFKFDDDDEELVPVSAVTVCLLPPLHRHHHLQFQYVVHREVDYVSTGYCVPSYHVHEHHRLSILGEPLHISFAELPGVVVLQYFPGENFPHAMVHQYPIPKRRYHPMSHQQMSPTSFQEGYLSTERCHRK